MKKGKGKQKGGFCFAKSALNFMFNLYIQECQLNLL